MRKTQRAITMLKNKRWGVRKRSIISRLMRAEQRAQAKFILNNWGL